jgi:hypothetical protein
LALTATFVSAEAARHDVRVSAAVSRRASNPAPAAQISREIASVDARLARCYAENRPTGPPVIQACNNKATEEFDALLRPSRQKQFGAFLDDLAAPLFHFVTKDGAGNGTMAMAISGTYRDLARKRAAILGGADASSRPSRLGHSSLKRLLGRLHGDPWLGQSHYGQHLQRHWTKVRNGDCAAYPVPHCAARLDAALADELEEIFSDK